MARQSTRLTAFDIKFLRQMHIKADAKLYSNWLHPTEGDTLNSLSDARSVFDYISKGGAQPTHFIISHSLARQIIAEYGEINWDTFQAFTTGRSNGKKDNK